MESPAYYRKLMDMAILAGTIMIASGAETHRVEDTLHRILATTNFEHAEAIVLTTGVIITLSDPSSETLSITRRVTNCSQNLGRVAEVNSVSRDFCSGKISLDEAIVKLREIKEKKRYSALIWLFGYILATSGFSIMFGGTLLDAAGAALCGVVLAFVTMILGPRIKRGSVTTILATMAVTLCATAIAYFGNGLFHMPFQTQYMIIGGMMPLVPGLAMTNAMRDVLHGDYLAAGSRIIEALLTAVCVAIGVAVGMAVSAMLGLADVLTFNFDLSASSIPEFILASIASAFAIIGFYIVFEVPKQYMVTCGLNGLLAWAVYLIADFYGASGLWATFFATLAVDLFSYYSARIMKAPVIIFLVAGLLPLVPGIGIYQAVYSLMFDMGDAAQKLMSALMTTGVIALAIFLMDTVLDIEKRIRKYIKAKRLAVKEKT